jgi:hypothetical protein
MNSSKQVTWAFGVLGSGAFVLVALFLLQGRDEMPEDNREPSAYAHGSSPKAAPLSGLPTALHGSSIAHEALLRVPSLDETCRKTAIAVSTLDLRTYGAALRRAADVSELVIPEDVVTEIEKVRAADKCTALKGKGMVAQAFEAYRTKCTNLAPSAKDSPQSRLYRLSACVESLRDFRGAIVMQAYGTYRYEQIQDPRALVILLEGTLRLGGEKQPEETYLIAKQLGRLRPNDVEAASIESQAAYVRFLQESPGERERALRDLEEAVDRLERIDPKSTRAQELRLGLLTADGDPDRLADAAAELRRAHPESEAGAVYTAVSHYLRGDRAAGIAELELFVREYPKNLRAALSLQMMKSVPDGASVREAFLDTNRVIFFEQFEEQMTTKLR